MSHPDENENIMYQSVILLNEQTLLLILLMTWKKNIYGWLSWQRDIYAISKTIVSSANTSQNVSPRPHIIVVMSKDCIWMETNFECIISKNSAVITALRYWNGPHENYCGRNAGTKHGTGWSIKFEFWLVTGTLIKNVNTNKSKNKEIRFKQVLRTNPSMSLLAHVAYTCCWPVPVSNT